MNNREIVSYPISRLPEYIQITEMLDKALGRHESLYVVVLHSNQ